MATNAIATIRAYSVLLAAGVLWGVTFPLSKVAMLDGAHPLGITQLQALTSGAILIGVCAARSRWPRFDVASIKMYLALATIGLAIPSTLFFAAAPHLPAGVMAITVSAVPLITYAAALAIGLERRSVRRLFGLVFVSVAVVLIVGPPSALPDPSATIWIIIVLGSAACYAFQGLYISAQMLRRPNMDVIAIICAFQCVAAVILWPIAYGLDGNVPVFEQWTAPHYAVLAVSFASVIAQSLYFYAIRTMGPVFSSQVAYLVTVAGVGWGMVLFDERHSNWVWAALIVMLMGLACVTPRRPARAEVVR